MCVPVGPETIACFFWLVIMSNEEWILNKRDPNAPEQGGESFVVTHKASEEFINRIQVERQSGYGFPADYWGWVLCSLRCAIGE